jgi:hypothetical protein
MSKTVLETIKEAAERGKEYRRIKSGELEPTRSEKSLSKEHLKNKRRQEDTRKFKHWMRYNLPVLVEEYTKLGRRSIDLNKACNGMATWNGAALLAELCIAEGLNVVTTKHSHEYFEERPAYYNYILNF